MSIRILTKSTRPVLVALLAIASASVAATNSAMITAQFEFDFAGAQDSIGSDITFDIEFESIPEGFNNNVSTTNLGGGASSSSASHTLGGFDLENEFETIEATFGFAYDTSFPNIVVNTSAEASASAAGDQGFAARTEWTLLTFGYFGNELSIEISFTFDMQWDAVHTIGSGGFVATDLSVIAYLLDDNFDPELAPAEFNITPCPGCLSGDSISIGKTTPGTAMLDETGIFGGPVNNGIFSLTVPDTSVASTFSVLIETRVDAVAVGPPAAPVPVPGAIWLLAPGLAALTGLRRKYGNT